MQTTKMLSTKETNNESRFSYKGTMNAIVKEQTTPYFKYIIATGNIHVWARRRRVLAKAHKLTQYSQAKRMF